MEKYILALDLGKGSLGLAISRSGMFIAALENIRFKAGDYNECIQKLKEVLMTEKVEHVVIGYPTYPSGDPCEMTPIVEAFIPQIQPLFPGINIVKVDERGSTVEASEMLHANNKNSKKQRKMIDSAAASIILERYLKQKGQM